MLVILFSIFLEQVSEISPWNTSFKSHVLISWELKYIVTKEIADFNAVQSIQKESMNDVHL